MDEMVYLYELDSVIKTKDDMHQALKKMYEVLREKGNVVVVSLNQIADSRFFDFWITDDKMKEILMRLLRSKAIVLLRQENLLTARSYLLKKFNDKEFISSFLKPIKDCISDTKKFSNIKKDIIKAIEICNTQDMFESDEYVGITELDDNMKSKIKNYIKFIIELCGDDIKYVDENKLEKDVEHYYELPDFIDIATNALEVENPDVKSILETLRNDDKDEDKTATWINRSKWINTIKVCMRTNVAFINECCEKGILNDSQRDDLNKEMRKKEIDVIRAISVCYAMRIESSICGVKDYKDHFTNVEQIKKYFLERFKDYKIKYEISDSEKDLECKILFIDENEKNEEYRNRNNWELCARMREENYQRKSKS